MSVDSRRPRSLAELEVALCELSVPELANLLRNVIERREAEEPRRWVDDAGVFGYVGFDTRAVSSHAGLVLSSAGHGEAGSIFVYTPKPVKETKANEH